MCRAVLLFASLILLTGCGRGVPAPRPSVAAIRLPPASASVRILVEPRDGPDEMLREIRHAQRRIFVCTYILTHRSVVHALQRAATEGVDVYVLLEHFPYGMGRQPEAMRNVLQAAGVNVRWASGRFTFTHAKYLVIDDRLALVSTANLSRSGFESNRDFVVVDRAPKDVREVSNLFRRDWDFRPERGIQRFVISPENARGVLDTLLAGAHHSVDIYAEEVDDPATERLLVALQRRGLRVRVLVPAGERSRGILYLTRGRVSVRVLSHPYIHAKAIVVDRARAFVGSENLSTTSLDQNRELGILIKGGPLTALLRTFEHDWKRGSSAGSGGR